MPDRTDALASPGGRQVDCHRPYRFNDEFNQIDDLLVSGPLVADLSYAGITRRAVPPEARTDSGASEQPFRAITNWCNLDSDQTAISANFNLN